MTRTRMKQVLARCSFSLGLYPIRHYGVLSERLSSMSVQQLAALAAGMKDIIRAQAVRPDLNPKLVFTNTELGLKHIDAYGFDYDFTLACYTPALDLVVYQMIMQSLVQDHGYPPQLLKRSYDPFFGIRGLHFDYLRGFLMKVDSVQGIQLGTVVRGRSHISDDVVYNLYGGTRLSRDSFDEHDKTQKAFLYQIVDKFSMPLVCILADIIEYFESHAYGLFPRDLFHDVEQVNKKIHKSGRLHNMILSCPEVYFPDGSKVHEYLISLKNAGKKLFMVTNSKYHSVNGGMTYLIGPRWQDLFDIIVVEAGKPVWFHHIDRPFRQVDPATGMRTWSRVDRFQPRTIYCEGNAKLFSQMTGFLGPNILYFGDHVNNDLMDAVLLNGWRTAAIQPEIENEISCANRPEYSQEVSRLLMLEKLIAELMQRRDCEKSHALLGQLKEERRHSRQYLRCMFNPYFGSVFRSFNVPTYYMNLLMTYADIYTSSLENMLHYSHEYVFYPTRGTLPHEYHPGDLSFENSILPPTS